MTKTPKGPSRQLQSLFEMMADECPGQMTMRSSKEDRISLRHEVHVGAPGGRRRPVRRDFEVRVPKEGHRLYKNASLELVEVRVRGLQDVLVSPLPSAVLAVALR